MRGLTLQLKEAAYVEAAYAIGASSLHIIWKHILPNALSAIIVRISLDLGFAVLTLASLGFDVGGTLTDLALLDAKAARRLSSQPSYRLWKLKQYSMGLDDE